MPKIIRCAVAVCILLYLPALSSILESTLAFGSSGPRIDDADLAVEIISEGLNFPTSMAFLGPGDILVLDKENGIVNRVVNGQISDVPSLDIPVASKGDRGMLGISISSGKNN